VPFADTAAAPLVSPAAATLPPLTRADVCIAGAGLPALLAAYLLTRERRSVVVLDHSDVGAVQPGIGIARLSSLADASWRTTVEREGPHGARVTAQSHAAAVDALEAIVRRERIACELERLDACCDVAGGLAGARAERAAALDAGIENVDIVESLAVPGGEWGPAVRHPGQVRLQPLKLAQGLARAIARGGGRVLLGVTPASLHLCGEPALVTGGGQRIEADVFITAHEPHAEGRLDALVPPRIAHVVGVHVPRGALAQALYRDARGFPIDASLLSHGRGAGEVLLVGREDPPGDDDHTAFRYLALEQWAYQRFPGAGPVVHRGTVQALPDDDLFAYGLANAQGVQACARGGSVLTRAMLDALAIADFVRGSDSPWAELCLRTPARDRAVHAA
jgi:glycine/D-amino acid oxidase-like deaminating enzyme